MQRVDRAHQLFGAARIVDEIVRGGAAFGAGRLRCHDRFDLRPRQPVARHDARDLQLGIAIDDQHAIDALQPMARLDEQRHRKHHINMVCGRRGAGAHGFGADFGSAFADIFEGIFGMGGATRQRGTGLGLAISRGLAEILGKVAGYFEASVKLTKKVNKLTK